MMVARVNSCIIYGLVEVSYNYESSYPTMEKCSCMEKRPKEKDVDDGDYVG